MTLLSNIILFFSVHPIMVTIVGSFFGGEETILTLAYISGQDLIPVWKLFVACIIGTFISDSMWYYFGKSRIIDKLVNHRRLTNGYKKVVKVLNKSSDLKMFFSMLLLKFAYGTRIITISYLSRERMNFKKFSVFYTAITIIWLLIIIPIGWLAGKGVSRFVGIYERLDVLIAVLLSVILFVYLSRLLLTKLVLGQKNKIR